MPTDYLGYAAFIAGLIYVLIALIEYQRGDWDD